MTKTARQPDKRLIVTVINSKREKDPGARPHTRANGLGSDSDRIEAARYAAMHLQRRISVHSDLDHVVFNQGPRWEHYCDSEGQIFSHCPERDPEFLLSFEVGQ